MFYPPHCSTLPLLSSSCYPQFVPHSATPDFILILSAGILRPLFDMTKKLPLLPELSLSLPRCVQVLRLLLFVFFISESCANTLCCFTDCNAVLLLGNPSGGLSINKTQQPLGEAFCISYTTAAALHDK